MKQLLILITILSTCTLSYEKTIRVGNITKHTNIENVPSILSKVEYIQKRIAHIDSMQRHHAFDSMTAHYPSINDTDVTDVTMFYKDRVPYKMVLPGRNNEKHKEGDKANSLQNSIIYLIDEYTYILVLQQQKYDMIWVYNSKYVSYAYWKTSSDSSKIDKKETIFLRLKDGRQATVQMSDTIGKFINADLAFMLNYTMPLFPQLYYRQPVMTDTLRPLIRASKSEYLYNDYEHLDKGSVKLPMGIILIYLGSSRNAYEYKGKHGVWIKVKTTSGIRGWFFANPEFFERYVEKR